MQQANKITVPPDYLIEPKFYQEYMDWQKNPDPTTTSALIKKINPVLKRASRAFGNSDSPVIFGHAKKLALEALESYDPRRGKLETHLMSNLQRLRRISARNKQIIKVPERVALDRMTIDQAEKELEDKLNRPPSIGELADYTGLSQKRIEKVYSYQRGISEGQLMDLTTDDESPYGVSPAVKTNKLRTYMDFLYDGLNPIDQFLMDRVMGRLPSRKLTPGQAAKQLGISPSAVSQRLKRIENNLRKLISAEVF